MNNISSYKDYNEVVLVNTQNFEEFNPILSLEKDLGSEFVADMKSYCLLTKVNYDSDIPPNSDDWKVFLIKYNNKTCGVIGFYRIRDNNEYWIAWFGIIEEFRNKGIGTKSVKELLKVIKKENSNANNLYVYVEDDNNLAIKFYSRIGMKILSTVDDFCFSNGLKKEDYFTTSTNDLVMYTKI